MKVRYSHDRGATELSWLKSKHSFSFGDYYDQNWTQFGQLRVINEDWIEPGTGFGMHPHKNMEIITIMLKGEMRHRDSMGNEESLRVGEVQAMTAGTGLTHSEWNPSDEQAHLFQLWIEPQETGLTPDYEQFRPEENNVKVLVSGNGSGLKINADAEVIQQKLLTGEQWSSAKNSQSYLHLIKGQLEIDDHKLEPGDAIAFDREMKELKSLGDSEFILINMYKEN
jgi:quercetin 2,3-dioxygenase